MANPLMLAALGLAGLLAFGKKGKAAQPVPSPVNPATGQVTPVAQRMAIVLGTNDPFAIRFEAGRLRQEGYPAQAAELEREAAKLEAQSKPMPAAPAPVVISSKPPVSSPGFVPQSVPPAVVQTPSGPVLMPQPAVVMPPSPVSTPPIVVPTPSGPISIPSVPLPSMPAAMPSIPLPSMPQLVPLPILAHGEVLSTASPGQTVNAKTIMVQKKLISLGLLPADTAVGPYGPKTAAAVQQFQLLANAYLKKLGKPMHLPTAGETVMAIKVDGKWGNQSNDMAALAHAPMGSGATASYFGSLDLAPPPQPASPLPGIVPPMMPQPINPKLALASRLAHNLSSAPPGQEDRSLVQLFQIQEALKPSGMYNASTAVALATRHGIVPPKPRYWTDTHTRKSKSNYRRVMRELAEKEPQRAEEWQRASEV